MAGTITHEHSQADKATKSGVIFKILVIEDQSQYARFVQSVFEDQGYHVQTASNAEEAMQLVAGEAPDLITLDLLMPGKTGVKLYRDLRKHENLQNTRIVILTGLDHDSQGLCSYNEFFKRISRGGQVSEPDAYLTKPIEAETLLHTAQKLLGQ